ncbi:MAG: hypothetical protein INH41_22105 [Myxococcaceae bacterium]|nr:hypothetical protein [Myxococcaceae bacterium]MCA3015089.1 hypothetical protein [Myxococcaceae bacterium]
MTSRTGCAVARGPVLAVAALVALACPSPMATLTVSAGTLRVGGEATVTVSAFTGAQPGSGAVEVSTSLGELGATSVPLDDGAGRTTLRCPRATPGCVAGASITLTARWNSPQGSLTETATVRVFEVSAGDGGGGMDGGGLDGGARDGGPLDGGALDGGPVEGILLFDGGTPLPQDRALVIGRIGPPRTLGFSELTTGAPVRLGFNELPAQALLYGGRLVYVRRGVLAAWTEDFADAGGEAADGGAPDGGEADGGELDAGALDGGGPDGGSLDSGMSFGPFPLFNPEGNDPVIATCSGVFSAPDAGVLRMVLPTPGGGVWLGCSETPTGPVRLLAKGSRRLPIDPADPLVPLAGEEQSILGVVDFADAGNEVVMFSQSASSRLRFDVQGRAHVRSATRAVPGGYEFLVFDAANDRCWLGSLDVMGRYSEVLLPAKMFGGRCQGARFDGPRDALLAIGLEVFDAGLESVVLELALVRSVDGGARDGGTSDGGAGDGGSVDAGRADAGPTELLPVVRFRAGPPSNFGSSPPALSIDLGSLVGDGGPTFITP